MHASQMSGAEIHVVSFVKKKKKEVEAFKLQQHLMPEVTLGHWAAPAGPTAASLSRKQLKRRLSVLCPESRRATAFVPGGLAAALCLYWWTRLS